MSQTIKGGLAGEMKASERGCLQITAQMHDHTMRLVGIPATKFYFDAKTNIEASVLVSRYYRFDAIAPGLDLYNLEIEALGGKMIYGDNSMPTIDFRDPLIKRPEDLNKLKSKKIDFYKDGRFPFMSELLNRTLEYSFTTIVFCAPFSMAVGLRSYPSLIKDFRKNPKFAHELFKFIVDDVLVPYIKSLNETTDILMAAGSDAWASIPNLSVKEMMEWVVPYNQRLMQKTKKLGVLTLNSSGAYCEERLEKFDPEILRGSLDVEIASQGQPMLFLTSGRWHEYPLEPVREYTAKYRKKGQNVTILAGIYAKLIRDGPVDKIVDTIKRYIDTFARDHNVIILLSNVPADTPSDHIHAAVAAVHTYGKLPIAENLDEIEFKLPEIEPFNEWKKKYQDHIIEFPKVEVRRGLAGLLWRQMEPINYVEKFKELYKNTKLTFLYNLTDQNYSALIIIDNGELDVRHIKNDKDLLNNLDVDASLTCATGLFFDFGRGEISKIGIIMKMLLGKLKIKHIRKMQELRKIMSLID